MRNSGAFSGFVDFSMSAFRHERFIQYSPAKAQRRKENGPENFASILCAFAPLREKTLSFPPCHSLPLSRNQTRRSKCVKSPNPVSNQTPRCSKLKSPKFAARMFICNKGGSRACHTRWFRATFRLVVYRRFAASCLTLKGSGSAKANASRFLTFIAPVMPVGIVWSRKPAHDVRSEKFTASLTVLMTAYVVAGPLTFTSNRAHVVSGLMPSPRISWRVVARSPRRFTRWNAET